MSSGVVGVTIAAGSGLYRDDHGEVAVSQFESAATVSWSFFSVRHVLRVVASWATALVRRLASRRKEPIALGILRLKSEEVRMMMELSKIASQKSSSIAQLSFICFQDPARFQHCRRVVWHSLPEYLTSHFKIDLALMTACRSARDNAFPTRFSRTVDRVATTPRSHEECLKTYMSDCYSAQTDCFRPRGKQPCRTTGTGWLVRLVRTTYRDDLRSESKLGIRLCKTTNALKTRISAESLEVSRLRPRLPMW